MSLVPVRRWNNVETFLKHGPLNKGEQRGCFFVNSKREFAILPPEAHAIVAESRVRVQHLLAMNIEAENPRMDPDAIAEMVLSSFSGICVEHNLKSGKAASTRKTESLMKAFGASDRFCPSVASKRVGVIPKTQTTSPADVLHLEIGQRCGREQARTD